MIRSSHLFAVILPLLLNSTAQAAGFVAEPDGRRIVRTVDVAIPVEHAWQLWTTQSGVTKFFAPEARVDLKVGGPYEIYFGPVEQTGSRGSETCTILTYLPNELLSFAWNAPPQFEALRFQHTWVVLRFEKLGTTSTRLHFTHYGFGAGEEWGKVHAYFERAWSHVLGNFSEVAARGSKRAGLGTRHFGSDFAEVGFPNLRIG